MGLDYFSSGRFDSANLSAAFSWSSSDDRGSKVEAYFAHNDLDEDQEAAERR